MAYPIELLKENYNPVVFFCNPNIYPEEEYLRRRDELIRYCEQEEYPYIIDEYEPVKWYESTEGKRIKYKYIHYYINGKPA